MKKYYSRFLMLCSLPLFLFSFSTPAYADSDLYLAFKLGYTAHLPVNFSLDTPISLKLKKSDSFAIGGAIGTSFKAISLLGLRAELEYLYRTKSDTSIQSFPISGGIQGQTVLGNLYLDIFFLPFANIYAGGGIGLSILDVELKNASGTLDVRSVNFSAQAGGGVQFILFKHLVLDLNIRYLYLGDWKQHGLKGKFEAVETLASIGYKF